MNLYLHLKLLHVFAVVIFMGNIITGLFWMRIANKTGDFRIISFTMNGIIRSDKWFTLPGVILITAGGISAAMHANLPILKTGWIFWSLVAFAISGIVYGARLAPLQKKIAMLAEKIVSGDTNKELYRSSLRQWEWWGLLAIFAPLAAVAMMTMKVPLHSGL